LIYQPRPHRFPQTLPKPGSCATIDLAAVWRRSLEANMASKDKGGKSAKKEGKGLKEKRAEKKAKRAVSDAKQARGV
jgi:hypothetical protein